jgi:hypothetical protein
VKMWHIILWMRPNLKHCGANEAHTWHRLARELGKESDYLQVLVF